MSAIPYSILDLAPVAEGESIADSFAHSVKLAQTAEASGYTRIWYAEHHNMSTIASSATSVLIGHIAHHTKTIRLGAGGIMLPNHSPLVIAEQFGTLETLFPSRIDLGLGRAPGTDPLTMHALRRSADVSDRFPEDVLELKHYLSKESLKERVKAVPGAGTEVPLYILGSSTFGARLAAVLGLPYAFASHFAPRMLHHALKEYKENFQPSEQLEKPYAIVGINVIANEDAELAEKQLLEAVKIRVKRMLPPKQQKDITDEDLERIALSEHGRGAQEMVHYRAIGTAKTVQQRLSEFAEKTGADELIHVHIAPDVETRLNSVKLAAPTI